MTDTQAVDKVGIQPAENNGWLGEIQKMVLKCEDHENGKTYFIPAPFRNTIPAKQMTT
jgi:hypothetical protein